MRSGETAGADACACALMWMRTDVVAMAAWAASRRGMLGWDRHNDEFGAVKTAGFLPLGRCPLRKHCSRGKQEDNDRERQR